MVSIYAFKKAPTAFQGEPYHVRLVQDLTHNEVFTVCQHDTVSAVLLWQEYLSNRTAGTVSAFWYEGERPYATEGLWAAIDATEDGLYRLVAESTPESRSAGYQYPRPVVAGESQTAV